MKHKKINWCYVVCTTAAIFLLGSLFHFIYGWTGNNMIAGLFFPINESVWEHLKLSFYPVILLWVVTVHQMHLDPEFRWTNRFTACTISVAVSFTVTASLYYLFLSGFGISFLFLHLMIYAFGIFCGQTFAVYLTFNARIPKWLGIISIILLALKVLEFACFSLQPPTLPIFISP